MIQVRLGSTKGRIVGDLDQSVQDALRLVCSYVRPEAVFQMEAAKRLSEAEPWNKRAAAMARADGRVSLYNRGTRTFPIGLWPLVEGVLKARRIEFQALTMPDHPHPLIRQGSRQGSLSLFNHVLRGYQKDVVTAALRARRGMIKVATGGGKTLIAASIMQEVSLRTVFFVHTKDLLYQAHNTFAEIFGAHSVGIIGDGRVSPAEITVCTLQTMARALGVIEHKAAISIDEDDQIDDKTQWDKRDAMEFLDSCGVVFMDECHRVAAPLAHEVVMAAKLPVYRFGLSASPWRDDGADIVLEGVFGQTLGNVTASYLIEHEYLVPPFIRMLSVPPQGFGKGTTYDTVYRRYVVENETRNRMGVDAALKMMDRGRQTLVLVRHLIHGRIIQDMIRDLRGSAPPFVHGETPDERRAQIIRELVTGSARLVVASTIADEGLDAPELSGLVLLSGGKSSTRALQRVGRTLRIAPGKRDAEIVDFHDGARWLTEHSRARERLYETEPGFTILDF